MMQTNKLFWNTFIILHNDMQIVATKNIFDSYEPVSWLS